MTHHHHSHDHSHSHHHGREHFVDAAWRHLDQLTKPPRSLGRIEELAAELCAIQGEHHPQTEPRSVLVFAGDHGVCEEGVSPYPQIVTGQMLKNMANGGACVSVLSKLYNARLRVIDVGTIGPHDEIPNITRSVVRAGTANFAKEPAMSITEVKQAMKVGSDAVAGEMAAGSKVFCFGEMGIGNTTSAAAAAAQILKCPVRDVVGPGTGLDESGMQRKAAVIERALSLHQANMANGVTILQHVGGLELAAIAGGIIQASSHHGVVVLDGFISTAAAAVAAMLSEDVKPALIASHVSTEPGHALLLEHLQKKPLLDLQMRLGEASGALLALPLLDAAASIYNNMATFESAGINHRE